MAATVKIDQSGAPAGVAGEAREDLVTGLAVTLTAGGGPFSAYQWVLDYAAVDADASGLARATSALTAPTSSVTQLSPVDKRGTYFGRLLVDSGAGLGAGADDVVEWSFYAGVSGDPVKGSPGADPTSLPRRAPAAGERASHNVPDALDPSGNPDGWARELLKWFSVVERVWSRQLFAAAHVQLTGAGATVLRGWNVSGASRTGTGQVTLTFDGAFPDADWAGGVVAAGATGGSGSVVAQTDSDCDVERGDPGGSLSDSDFLFFALLRF